MSPVKVTADNAFPNKPFGCSGSILNGVMFLFFCKLATPASPKGVVGC